jgi:predicted kinase
MSGQVGSGKTTVARALARRWNAARVEGDELRRTLLEEDSRAGEPSPLHTFDSAIEERVYARLLREAERLLWSGESVVLDAGFPTRAQRAAALKLARAHDLTFLLVECRVDDATAQDRLAERDGDGDDEGWRALATRYAHHYEPVDELDPALHVVVDGSHPVEESVATVDRHLATAGRQEAR